MERMKHMEHQDATTTPARELQRGVFPRLTEHAWNTRNTATVAGPSRDRRTVHARIQRIRTRAQPPSTAELIGCDTLPRNVLQPRGRYAAESTVADTHVLSSMKPLRTANTRTETTCPTADFAFIGY